MTNRMCIIFMFFSFVAAGCHDGIPSSSLPNPAEHSSAPYPSEYAQLALDRAVKFLEELDGKPITDEQLERLKPPHPHINWGNGGFCSEGYVWSIKPWFPEFENYVIHHQIAHKFENYEQLFSDGDLEEALRDIAQPGDWLGIDSNDDGETNHTGMFIEYDWTRNLIKSIEFNVEDSRVLIQVRPISQITNLGHLIRKMEFVRKKKDTLIERDVDLGHR